MHFGLAKMNMYVDNEKTIVTDYLSREYLYVVYLLNLTFMGYVL